MGRVSSIMGRKKTNRYYSSDQMFPKSAVGGLNSISDASSFLPQHKLLMSIYSFTLGGNALGEKEFHFQNPFELPSPGVPPCMSECESFCERGLYEGPRLINHAHYILLIPSSWRLDEDNLGIQSTKLLDNGSRIVIEKTWGAKLYAL